MSGFIGGAQFILARKNEGLQRGFRSRDGARSRTQSRLDYVTGFWPGNRGGDALAAVWSGPLEPRGQGNASLLGFVGVTRDQYGAPLGGVTCSLFLTATRAWIMDVISDANGNFLLQTWYSPAAHFIVFHKAGAPAVFGATDQNLTGA